MSKTEVTFPDLQHGVESEHSVKAIVRFHEMRNENVDLYVALWRAVTDAKKQKILKLVHLYDGVVYDDLYTAMTCSKRTVRTKVGELESEGVLDKQGKPAHIDFATDETAIMASDILSALEESSKELAQ